MIKWDLFHISLDEMGLDKVGMHHSQCAHIPQKFSYVFFRFSGNWYIACLSSNISKSSVVVFVINNSYVMQRSICLFFYVILEGTL